MVVMLMKKTSSTKRRSAMGATWNSGSKPSLKTASIFFLRRLMTALDIESGVCVEQTVFVLRLWELLESRLDPVGLRPELALRW